MFPMVYTGSPLGCLEDQCEQKELSQLAKPASVYTQGHLTIILRQKCDCVLYKMLTIHLTHHAVVALNVTEDSRVFVAGLSILSMFQFQKCNFIQQQTLATQFGKQLADVIESIHPFIKHKDPKVSITGCACSRTSNL